MENEITAEQIAHFVYTTKNPLNGNFYIGKHSTKNINDGYLGSGIYVKRCLKKGIPLTRTILVKCDSDKEAYMFEKNFVKLNFDNPKCMNFSNQGHGFSSGEHNVMKQPNMKIKIMGKNNPNYGKKPYNFQKETPQEVREKISKANKGKVRTDKAKETISNSLKNFYKENNHHMIGKTLSEETKEKLRLKNLGRKLSNKQCPYCLLVGAGGSMVRFHFNNCKQRSA